MTTNAARAATLVRALRAGIDGDHETVRMLVTDDVRAWTPAFSTVTRDELIDALDRRDDAFSELALDAAPLDVGGDYACVEWTLEMTHTGRFDVDAGTTIEATGLRVALHGTTVAEFRSDQICSVRQYWDQSELVLQLGAAAEDDEAAEPA